MTRARAVSDALARTIEAFIAVCFSVILVTTIVLVTLRYGLNTSIKGGNELIEYLFIYTTALGAAASIGRHGHIKIEALVRVLPMRVQVLFDMLVQLLVASINAVILVLSVSWIRQVGSFESPVMRVPNWIVQVIVPVGCALAVIFCVLNIARDLAGDPGFVGESDDVAPR